MISFSVGNLSSICKLFVLYDLMDPADLVLTNSQSFLIANKGDKSSTKLKIDIGEENKGKSSHVVSFILNLKYKLKVLLVLFFIIYYNS